MARREKCGSNSYSSSKGFSVDGSISTHSAARSASRNFDKRNFVRILGIAYLLGEQPEFMIYFDHKPGGQYLARRTSQEWESPFNKKQFRNFSNPRFEAGNEFYRARRAIFS